MPAPYRQEVELVRCPLCDLPHRVGAVTCDSCKQLLSEPPNFDGARVEHARRKREMGLAVGAIVAMVGLNAVMFGGVGFILATAPIAWFARAWVRYRALSRLLARSPSRP